MINVPNLLPTKALALLLSATLLSACDTPPPPTATHTPDTKGAPTTNVSPLSQTSTSISIPTPTDEILLLQLPIAWLRLAEQSTDTFRLAEFIPAGQDKDDWFDRIFVESNALEPLPDPIFFLEAMGREIKTECDGNSDANIHSGIENGYATSVRLLVCNKNRTTARGEVTLIKAIRGNDNFYVISRARRSEALQNDASPISQREMAEWSLYMRSIKLCDPRNPEHPCPTNSLNTTKKQTPGAP